MELKDQVCTLDQAKRLKELGVKQDSYHCYNHPKDSFWKEDYPYEVKIIRSLGLYGFYSEFEYYSAYTVAELGLMLPEYYYSVRNSFMEWGTSNTEEDVLTEKHKLEDLDEFILKGTLTEAQSRASLLIYLLENNYITAEQVNQSI